MKLLFDQNLSHRLVSLLATEFPGSMHVRDLGLSTADDSEIWTFAAANDFSIVSKDIDFQNRSQLFGHPPKVIWLRVGNRSTSDIVALMQLRLPDILAFESNPTASFLTLK